MNIKGIMKPAIPSWKADNPVFQGSEPAIPAPAYAASATGGVMSARVPKYRMNRWAAMASTPI
jgi:hypothetical protein